MKKIYSYPVVELISLNMHDVIASSNNASEDGENVSAVYMEDGGLGDKIPY